MTVQPRAYACLSLLTVGAIVLAGLVGAAATVGAALLAQPPAVHVVPVPAPTTPATPAPPAVELVVISASWCGPCKQLHAELDARGDVLTAAGVPWRVLTDDKAAEKKYHVTAYPTIVLLRDGREAARRTGYAPAADLAAWAAAN